MVVIGQKWLFSAKSGGIRESGCSREKMVAFGQSGSIRAKVVAFGQSGCIGAKVVVFGKKLLYSG